jgi:hypothetical protein
MRPVNVALVRLVAEGNTKSSADSISNWPPESGREAEAINPSGLPVLKKKGVAAAGDEARIAVRSPTDMATDPFMNVRIALSVPARARSPTRLYRRGAIRM